MNTAGAILLAVAGMFLAEVPAVLADDDAQGGPNIGERLFLETRFAQFFFTNSGGNANAVLTNGDPVMNTTASIYGPLPGPFAGQSMNCRACHMVEEQETTGNRTYCDFAPRSPIPNIGDGRTTTTRNAMPLVDALLPRTTPLLLHHDGQFASVQDLIVATLTGRNYGWTPTEYQTAIHHIADIIRNDDGSGGLAQQYGGLSYAETFDPGGDVPTQYLIPPPDYMDVTITDTNDLDYVTDEQIVGTIAALIENYLETLVFSQDELGQFNGSPYDAFLAKNGLPQGPDYNETPLHYARRLLQLIAGLSNPQWVTDPADGHFVTNARGQLFQFGSNELAGLEIFFTDSATLQVATNLQQQGITTGIEVGNCIACHAPPAFTDFLFHNNGAAQQEYDGIHGAGAFMALAVPGLSTRQTNYNAYLPPTTSHPYALGTFETPPTTNNPGQVDLGLWNVFANPDFPAPQAGLQQILPQLLSAPSPLVSATMLNAANFVLSATNVTPGGTYYVLASTNLLLPLYAWTIAASNEVDAAGQFSFTYAVNHGVPRQFYVLSLASISAAAALPQTIALFKTPTVRDLVSSEPYLHTGQMDTIEDVINFYLSVSADARAGTVRNADPQLSGTLLDGSAVAPLAAFLRALDEEDYADIPCPCQ
jgi:cytochrome c peroxidase